MMVPSPSFIGPARGGEPSQITHKDSKGDDFESFFKSYKIKKWQDAEYLG